MFGAEYFTLVGSYDEGWGYMCLGCTEAAYEDEHEGQEAFDVDAIAEWLQRAEGHSALMEAESDSFENGLYCEGCGEVIFPPLCSHCGDELGEGSGEASAVGAEALSVYDCDALCGDCMKLQGEAEEKDEIYQADLTMLAVWNLQMRANLEGGKAK